MHSWEWHLGCTCFTGVSAYERDLVTNGYVQFRTLVLQPNIWEILFPLWLLCRTATRDGALARATRHTEKSDEVRLVQFGAYQCHMYSCVFCLSLLIWCQMSEVLSYKPSNELLVDSSIEAIRSSLTSLPSAFFRFFGPNSTHSLSKCKGVLAKHYSHYSHYSMNST